MTNDPTYPESSQSNSAKPAGSQQGCRAGPDQGDTPAHAANGTPPACTAAPCGHDAPGLERDIGPSFAGSGGRKARGRRTGDCSAKALAIAKRVRRAGGNFADFLRALDNDPDTAAWKREKGMAWGGRELRRTWENANPGATPGPVTEDLAAQLFADRRRDDLRYDHTRGAWYVWNGAIWDEDKTRGALGMVRELMRELGTGAGDTGTRIRLESAASIRAVEQFARVDEILKVTSAVWNQDPWLLGTPDGTVDLRTGKLRAALPSDHISRTTSVAPAETEACPTFLRFMRQVTAGDEAMIAYLKRWCGYRLTGVTREHALLFVYGPGGNGKSVLINTLAGILGTYAANAALDTFTVATGERHSTDLAALCGARLVTVTEVEEGRAWAEARIKAVTGGDAITARFMRCDYFTYIPTYKLMISGNHQPILRNVDDAMRRRLHMLPFLHKPEHPDPELPARLREEWPGILRWMINGCLEYQRTGLKPPPAVVEATRAYFDAQDHFGQWLKERCVLGPDRSARPGELLDDFKAWCTENGVPFRDNKWLKPLLVQVPGVRYAKVKGSQLVRGIGLK